MNIGGDTRLRRFLPAAWSYRGLPSAAAAPQSPEAGCSVVGSTGGQPTVNPPVVRLHSSGPRLETELEAKLLERNNDCVLSLAA